MIWHARGGSGPTTLLFLHGLGATGAVWTGVCQQLAARPVNWISPDFSGHGLSAWRDSYSVGQLAAEVAPLVRQAESLFVVGHSLGVYVGLALASRWFGVRVAGLLGIGPKIQWSDADLQGARELAARPSRWYQQPTEAWTRYRRVAGLETSVTSDEAPLARGITQGAEGWRLSHDPRTYLVAGAPFSTLAAAADTRLILARGAGDPMVSLAELQQYDPGACDIAGAGHNAHVEKPATVLDLLDELLAAAAA